MTARKAAAAQPPTGGNEIERVRGEFWNPKEKGDHLYGTLVGTTKIKNQRGEERLRYVMQVDDDVFTLPDHYDLMEKLDKAAQNNGAVLGVRVWIEYTGRVKVPNVPSPMYQYRVIDYGVTRK